MHLGPPVLDKVERSWSCWRHPNASGVGLKVAGAMETVEPHKAQSDFLEGGCGTVLLPESSETRELRQKTDVEFSSKKDRQRMRFFFYFKAK